MRCSAHVVAAGTLFAYSERGSIEIALSGGNPYHVAIQALCALPMFQRTLLTQCDTSCISQARWTPHAAR